MCGSEYLAQPPWFNFPEWEKKEKKKNEVCIYSRYAAGCRQINFVIGVENSVREKKKRKGCLTPSMPWHDMIEKIALAWI